MRIAALLLASAFLVSCRPERFSGPVHLLETPAVGTAPRSARVTIGAETRPSLLSAAEYDVVLPRQGLLTFGVGVERTGGGEPPGWLHVVVRSGERVVSETRLNPRHLLETHTWRDVSVPVPDLGRRARLRFELRLAEKDGAEVPVPVGLVLAVSDPVLHDLEHYGRGKGVVLVSIDTLRRDHVGAYGYTKPTTPRLDALARAGIVADDAVSTSSWTLPAHLSMLTSTSPGVHGGVGMHVGFNHKPPTLPALLKAAGFATRAVTSWLYVSGVYGLDDGFDHLDFDMRHRANDVAERAIDLLDRFGDKPFFVFLHFYDPHWHYDPHETTTHLFEDGYQGKFTGKWSDFKDVDPAKMPPEDLRHMLALYDGEIRFTDDALGRVLDHLKARGLDKNTLVVVTSDHGEEFGEHGSWEHQKTLYEEVIRVPLIVSGPGVTARREKAPASLVDVAPTILAWVGLAPKWRPEGQSLLTPLGPRAAPYGETQATTDGTRKLFVRDGERSGKMILSLDPRKETIAREEWYDLAADPQESRSRPPREEAAGPRRAAAIARWCGDRQGGFAGPKVELNADEIARMIAMGYIQRFASDLSPSGSVECAPAPGARPTPRAR